MTPAEQSGARPGNHSPAVQLATHRGLEVNVSELDKQIAAGQERYCAPED